MERPDAPIQASAPVVETLPCVLRSFKRKLENSANNDDERPSFGIALYSEEWLTYGAPV